MRKKWRTGWVEVREAEGRVVLAAAVERVHSKTNEAFKNKILKASIF
jgi:hypothetical protein